MKSATTLIRQANTRDEIISILADNGISFNAPIGLLMRQARKEQEWVKLDLLHLANQKMQGMYR